MAERTATTWTCERCGVADEVRQGDQPTGWSRLRLTTPPKAEYDPQMALHAVADLCRRCTSSARSFMERLPQAADEVSE